MGDHDMGTHNRRIEIPECPKHAYTKLNLIKLGHNSETAAAEVQGEAQNKKEACK